MDTHPVIRAHGDRFVLTTPLQFEPPYKLPPALPDLISAAWRHDWSVAGPVTLAISSKWWRPLEHFTGGTYDLLDDASKIPPPLLPESQTIALVVRGLVQREGGRWPVITRHGQIATVTWAGSSWELGTHIKPTPGKLIVELSRPNGWTAPAPRSLAAAA